MSDRYNEQIAQIDITLPAPEREPERQFYFIKACREMIQKKARELGRPLSCKVATFG